MDSAENLKNFQRDFNETLYAGRKWTGKVLIISYRVKWLWFSE